MAGNANRNVSVDITGDPSSLENAYDRASKKAKDLDDELDKNSNKDKNRWQQWFTEIESFSKAGVSTLSGMGGQSQLIIAGIIAGIFALGPAAQVAAGALTLAFGSALLGIGILAASESGLVRAEFSQLWQDIKTDLMGAAIPIEQSLLRIPDVWRSVWAFFRPELESAFSQIAPVLDTFIVNFSNGFRGLVPAIQPLTTGFNQLLIALGQEAPRIFEELGRSIETLANTATQHADQFASFISGIMSMVSGTATAFDWLADEWSEALAQWEDTINTWLGSFGGELSVDLDNIAEKFDRITQTGLSTIKMLQENSTSMIDLKTSAGNLNTELQELSGVHLTADRALMKYTETYWKANALAHENTKTLDQNSAEGRENSLALIDMAEQTHRLMVAKAAEGATVRDLRAIYLSHKMDLEQVARGMGLTKKEAEELSARYIALPRSIHTAISADASAAQREIDNFIVTNSGRQIPINVYNKMSQLADGGYIGYPNGGLVRGPGGSRTDSVPARLSRGEYVMNASATRRNLPMLEAMNSGRGVGGMGGNTVIYQINTSVAPTANLAAVGSQIVESIQAYETRSGKTWRGN